MQLQAVKTENINANKTLIRSKGEIEVLKQKLNYSEDQKEEEVREILAQQEEKDAAGRTRNITRLMQEKQNAENCAFEGPKSRLAELEQALNVEKVEVEAHVASGQKTRATRWKTGSRSARRSNATTSSGWKS